MEEPSINVQGFRDLSVPCTEQIIAAISINSGNLFEISRSTNLFTTISIVTL